MNRTWSMALASAGLSGRLDEIAEWSLKRKK